MKSTDGTSTTPSTDPAARGEIDDMLKRWPEVAAPSGGYDALVERTEKAVGDARAVDEGLDVFAKPVLPGVPGEPESGDGPKLETLAALARESKLPEKRESRLPEKSAPSKDPRSGVINLKAMIEQAAATESDATKLATALSKDGAPSMAAATAATPLATTQPSTPVAIPAKPEKKSGSSMFAVAAIVVIAGAGAYVYMNQQRAEAPSASDEHVASDEGANEIAAAAPSREEEGEGRGGDTDRAAADLPAAPVTATAAPAADPAPATGSEPASREGGAGAHRPREARPAPAGGAAHEAAHGEPAPAATPTAAPAAPPAEEAPAAPAPTKRGAQDLDALINGSLGPAHAADPAAPPAGAGAAPAAPPEGALPGPNRQQLQRGIGRVAGAVRACAGGQTGMVMLRITFMSDGSVSSVSVASGPFAGSAAAGCMENAARSARVPPFTNASVTVNYPIVVQPPDPAAAAPAPAP